ncbi:retrotransposon protein, putative, ty1-copia subclass [Tanacetum coccineum]
MNELPCSTQYFKANTALHAIRSGRVQKNHNKKPHKAAKGGQGKKGKMGYAPNNAPFAHKPKIPPTPKKENPAKDAIFHQCGEVGHWRRNCPVYLTELMKKKKLSQGASTLVWGCEALVKRDTLTKPDKLDPRSFSPSENKVFVARNAEFFENDLIDLKASGSVEDLEIIQEEDTNPSVDTSLNHKEDDQEIDEPQSDINPIRRSTRTRRPSDRLYLYIDAKEHELGDLGEPANYKAALLDPESKKWLHAMNVEMQSMKDNDVWVLVELPPNARTVGIKWLFKKKTDMDGAIYIFKARLVAKGFTQTYGVDYEETFSPVADIRAIRILIAIAAYYDYEIWQMDVKIAFLNGHLSVEVYMEQPITTHNFHQCKYPSIKLDDVQSISYI